MRPCGTEARRMSITAESPIAPADLARLRSRAHTLALPRSMLGRLGLAFQNALEAWVVRVSRLPDTPVYDPADFPWVRGIQSQWRSIRSEEHTSELQSRFDL